MKNLFIAATVLAALLMIGCGGNADDSKDTTSTKYERRVIVGIDDEFPPMAFRDGNGNIVGFDIDLAKEAARRLGVEFEFKPIVWSNKEHEITSGNIDMIWNGLDITPERKEYMIFSKPYIDDRQIIVVRKGNDKDIHSEGDLTGKIVGTQSGSTSEQHVNETPALKNSFKDFKVYLNFKDAFNALDSGEVDVLICDEIVGRYGLIRNPGKFDVLEITVGHPCEIGIAFRKNDVELRDKVQKVFDGMIKDGTAKKISVQWFQADVIKQIR